MINKTRELYRKLLKGHKLDSKQVADVIQGGKDLKNLQKHPGFARLQRFISEQKVGSEELLEQEMGSVHVISIIRFFTTFLKYFMIVAERRAYRKIENYINLSIQRGQKYEEAQRKQEERESKKG